MILNLDKKEMSALVLHMTIMRKPVKKGFKKNYGSQEGKEVLASYDEVKKALSDVLRLDQEEIEIIDGPQEIHFNIKEVNMMESFLTWYVKEVNESIGEKKVHQADREQIDTLEQIKDKVEGLKVAYA